MPFSIEFFYFLQSGGVHHASVIKYQLHYEMFVDEMCTAGQVDELPPYKRKSAAIFKEILHHYLARRE